MTINPASGPVAGRPAMATDCLVVSEVESIWTYVTIGIWDTQEEQFSDLV